MDIITLWHDHYDIEWWKILLIGLFFLVSNTAIFLAMWYCRVETLLEYGYPKRKMKTMRKRFKVYSVWDKLLLLRPSRDAKRKGPMLYLNLASHYLCLIALGSCFTGFGGCMVTRADGWTLTLLIFPELTALFFTTVIMFIPDLIWLPSARRRYRIK